MNSCNNICNKKKQKMYIARLTVNHWTVYVCWSCSILTPELWKQTSNSIVMHQEALWCSLAKLMALNGVWLIDIERIWLMLNSILQKMVLERQLVHWKLKHSLAGIVYVPTMICRVHLTSLTVVSQNVLEELSKVNYVHIVFVFTELKCT